MMGREREAPPTSVGIRMESLDLPQTMKPQWLTENSPKGGWRFFYPFILQGLAAIMRIFSEMGLPGGVGGWRKRASKSLKIRGTGDTLLKKVPR